jgi:diguanylate cyclase (GGDEF)-like protein
LPGNVRIAEEIEQRCLASAQFAVLYADLDHFKAYNDFYGFMRGDQVIQVTGRLLQDVVLDVAGQSAFVGHVGGDDFVFVCMPEQADEACERVIKTFDQGVVALYDPEDVAAGSISLVDRRGEVQRYPIVSVSIGVAIAGRRKFRDHREIVAVATEMKAVAKAQPGSAVAVDRRSDGWVPQPLDD